MVRKVCPSCGLTSDVASTADGEGGGGGDREQRSTPIPSVTARRIFVIVCWLGITATAFFDPLLLFLAWPVTGLAFLVTLLEGAAELRAAFAFKEQLSYTRLHTQLLRTALVLLVGCSIVGAITSVVPSMAFRSEDGDILYEYGLSGLVAPTLWAAILVASISAIMVPSPRRLALASGAGLVGWPLFLAIRALREPFLDLDNQFLLLAPWIVQLYVVAAVVASGLAIALAFGAARIAAAPVMQMPPKASMVSRS